MRLEDHLRLVSVRPQLLDRILGEAGINQFIEVDLLVYVLVIEEKILGPGYPLLTDFLVGI